MDDERMINTETTTTQITVIGNAEDLANDQSEVPDQTTTPSGTADSGQMMSRRRARALAKQLAAAGIDTKKWNKARKCGAWRNFT